MKIIATCMAGSEDDVIESFVRHNLRFVDSIVVLAHGSFDDTRRVLADLAREGLPLVVLHDDEPSFLQTYRQTMLAHRYLRELGADFCLVLDADEFIKCASREALERSLALVGPYRFGHLPWQNYLPPAEPNEERDVLKRMTLRVESPALEHEHKKVVLSRRFLDSPRWQVSGGNHFAIEVEGANVQCGEHVVIADACLGHFPVRSGPQVARKVLVGWLAHRLTNAPRTPKGATAAQKAAAWHWQELYERLMDGETLTAEVLREITLRYYVGIDGSAAAAPSVVDDPIASAFDLRYTAAEELSPVIAVTRWTELLIERLLKNSTSQRVQ